MPVSEQRNSTSSRRHARFHNTLWSQVFAARRPEGPEATQALESLCRLYWFPIYAFLRRWGHDRQDARDLTQGFFAFLLRGNLLRKADPEKGRFRSFLLGSLRKFVANQEAKKHALKRGGAIHVVSIDEETAEGRYAHEPATELTPEKLFDRRWALEAIAEAMRRLEAEYRRAGMIELFTALQPFLVDEQNGGFAALAARLRKSEGNARVVVFRLRNHFRKLIRGVIADTLSDANQVEDELRHLQAALRGD